MHTQRRLVISGAATMMVGSICPWATVFGFVPISGLQCRLGWGTLLAGALLLLLELRPPWVSRQLGWLIRHERLVQLATSGLAILICLLVMLGLSGSGPVVRTEWGLYLTLVAGGAVVWAALRRPL